MFPPRADILKALRMGGGDSFYAWQGGDLRREHDKAADADRRGDGRAASSRKGRRRSRARKARRGQSAAGAVGHPALFRPRGKRGRPLSGRLRCILDPI